MKQRGEYLFSSIHKALESSFNTKATADSIKCPSYEVPTANGTDKKASKTAGERHIEADWILSATRGALSPVRMAWVTCTYDGAGEAKEAALTALADAYQHLHKNRGMLRAIIEREFIFGESYCPFLKTIGKAHGTTEMSACRLAAKVQIAMRELGAEVNKRLARQFDGRGWIPDRKAA